MSTTTIPTPILNPTNEDDGKQHRRDNDQLTPPPVPDNHQRPEPGITVSYMPPQIADRDVPNTTTEGEPAVGLMRVPDRSTTASRIGGVPRAFALPDGSHVQIRTDMVSADGSCLIRRLPTRQRSLCRCRKFGVGLGSASAALGSQQRCWSPKARFGGLEFFDAGWEPMGCLDGTEA